MCVEGQVKWGGTGEEADKVGTLGTRSQCTAYSMLKHLGFILHVLGCHIIYMK